MSQSPAQGIVAGKRSYYPVYVLSVLTLISCCNNLDRAISTLLLEPLRREFHLSDGQLGFYAGPVYAFSCIAFGIPFGILADRYGRKLVFVPLLTIWSLATAVSGLATTYSHLVASRASVAAAESSSQAISLSLLADYFPRRQWPLVASVLSLGIPTGAATAYFGGGWILSHFGWRAAFFAAGIPGLILASLLALTVREKPRDGDREPGQARDRVTLTAIGIAYRRQPVLLLVILSSLFMSIGFGSLTAWLPTFFIRSIGFTPTIAGLFLALSNLLSGVTATLASGVITRRIAVGGVHRLALWCGSWLLIAVPVAWFLLFAGDRTLSVLFLFAFSFSSYCYYGPSAALMLSLSPSDIRTSIATIGSIVGGLFGYGLGALLTGTLSDIYGTWLGKGQGLRWAMATGVSVALLGALNNLYITSRLRNATLRDAVPVKL